MSTLQATLNASGVRAERAAAPSKLRLRKAKSAVLLGLVWAAAAITCALLFIGLRNLLELAATLYFDRQM